MYNNKLSKEIKKHQNLKYAIAVVQSSDIMITVQLRQGLYSKSRIEIVIRMEIR